MNASYGIAVIAGTVAAVSLGTLSYSMMRQRPPLPVEAQAVAPGKADRDPVRVIPLPTKPMMPIERVAPFFEPSAPLPEAPKLPPPKVATQEEPPELEPDPNPGRRNWHWHEKNLRHTAICARHGGELRETHHGKSWRCVYR